MLVALISSLTIILAALHGLLLSYSPVISFDEWSEFTAYDHLIHLFSQHNEHRLPVARLIYIADDILVHGTSVISLAILWLLQTAHAILLFLVARRAGLRGTIVTLWIGSFVLAFLFWTYQWQNLFWGVQVCYMLVFTASTGAFAALVLMPGMLGVALSAICAAVAAYSLAPGLLVPILLVILGYVTGRQWREIAFLAAFAVLTITPYFIGYSSVGEHAKPLDTLFNHTDELILYVLAYLGAPLGDLIRLVGDARGIGLNRYHALSIAVIVGIIGLALLTGITFLLLRRRDLATAPRLALLFVMAFAAGTAVLTGLGRINFGLYQAFESRYGTMALIFWISLTLLMWSLLLSGRLAWITPGVATLVTVLMATTTPQLDEQARELGQERRDAASALLAGVFDSGALLKIFPDPAVPLDRSGLLREAELSIFAEDWASWQGTPLSAHLAIEQTVSCGHLDEIEKLHDTAAFQAWRARGWAWVPRSGSVPEKILLVDTNMNIVGYGFTGYARPDVAASVHDGSALYSGWQGHLRSTANSITAYAITGNGQVACYLSSSKLADQSSSQ
jgi:hypothetical protein